MHIDDDQLDVLVIVAKTTLGYKTHSQTKPYLLLNVRTYSHLLPLENPLVLVLDPGERMFRNTQRM